MRTGLLLLIIGVAVAIVGAHPVDVSSQGEGEVEQPEQPLVREKRTIGILRDLFPNFSKMIDQKIQMITRFVFRIVGRLVLNGGGAGGGGGGGGEDDERRISITLPTYPPDLIDEDEDEDSTDSSSEGSDSTTTTVSPDGDDENAVAESQVKEVRVKREIEKKDEPAAEEEEEASSEDLDTEATGDNEVSEDNEAESSELEDEEEEEDPRNKRFLNFNLGATAGAGGASAGSGGGSGNFLFDIIRRSADRAARMAGTVYRVLAGTDDAGLPTYEAARSLVAGSGQTQAGDGSANAAIEEAKDDAAYGVGVPGPLTRLFVVANKGVASLIQDLILRLAQTSERIVNFKARLITSII